MFSFKRSVIALVGLLVIIGTLAALMPLVSRGQGGNPLTRDQRRSFYLTPTFVNGGQPLTACAAGYHMASLWEIFDTSNLRYDTELGQTLPDSGFGPPSIVTGWIRTGIGTGDPNTPGTGNCEVWVSDGADDFGTIVSLHNMWNATDVTVVSPWRPETATCDSTRRVWCVQD